MSRKLRITGVIGIVVLAAILLLAGPEFVSHWTIAPFKDDVLDGMFRYQVYAIAVAFGTALVLRTMHPTSVHYLRAGDLERTATHEAWLGINGRSSWLVNGAQLLVVVSVITATFMYSWRTSMGETLHFRSEVLHLVLLFSCTNALAEELIFRYALVSGLQSLLPARTIMVLSAVFFGLPHFFGHPSGLIGVAMAGVLGYVLCKATLETKGLLVGWAIHFVQDVLIFQTLLME
jgi:uncharacterized protein